MKHLATTAAGILTIIGSLCTFAGIWLKGGVPSSEAWTALGAGLAMGVGLVKAADASKVSPAAPPSPPPEAPPSA